MQLSLPFPLTRKRAPSFVHTLPRPSPHTPGRVANVNSTLPSRTASILLANDCALIVRTQGAAVVSAPMIANHAAYLICREGRE
jgi:hypothetical protein